MSVESIPHKRGKSETEPARVVYKVVYRVVYFYLVCINAYEEGGRRPKKQETSICPH